MSNATWVTVDRALEAVVRPGWFLATGVRVVTREPALDGPLRQAAAAMRVADARTEVTDAVRQMYRRMGLDPTKIRPSSEALLRRVRRGEELPRINSLVDIANWCSLETRLPYGLYDADKIEGLVTMRLGRAGEQYAGIGKDVVHLEGRLTLADGQGPFGNPTSDSARTMVTTETRRALVVIFAPAGTSDVALARVVGLTEERIGRFALR